MAELVRARADCVEPGDATVLAILGQIIGTLPEPTALQEVRWDIDAWRRYHAPLALADAVDRVAHGRIQPDGRAVITRDQVGSHVGSPIDLFVAAMAWGFGERGYGWHRTRGMFGEDGAQRVPKLVGSLRSSANDPEEIWRVLRGSLGLRGLGPAFGTKLAYFASYHDKPGTGPLIADRWTAWAFWAFTERWDIRASARSYAEYVHSAQAWAARLGRRPDDVERAFFIAGPHIRQAWRDAVKGG